MSNIIADLWNGRVAPMEDCGRNHPQVRELIRLLDRNEEKLTAELTQGQKCTLDKYTACWEEYLDLITEEAFCSGFCLGSKLLTQALMEKNEKQG